MAGNNGVIYHAALRFPNALDSGVTFDGNTVTTATTGSTVPANQNFSLRLTPRIVAKKSIDHHKYSADGEWAQSTQTVTDISKYVPIGNIFKAEIIARAGVYHGGNLTLRAQIQMPFVSGGVEWAQFRCNLIPEATDKGSINHAATGVSAVGSINFNLWSWTDAANKDRQIIGDLLIWDLGPSSWIPDFS
jgi:hypothetical protein